MGVSIPDRYAKNLVRLSVTTEDIKLFQFLIGTLKTWAEVPAGFPSIVSIPDRYAKNSALNALHDFPSPGFNS